MIEYFVVSLPFFNFTQYKILFFAPPSSLVWSLIPGSALILNIYVLFELDHSSRTKRSSFWVSLNSSHHSWKQDVFELKVFFRLNEKTERHPVVYVFFCCFGCCHFNVAFFITLFLDLAHWPRPIGKLRNFRDLAQKIL